MKDDAMIGIAQKLGPAFHGFENTTFTFDPQLTFVDIGLSGHQAHQALRPVNIELIDDEMPFSSRRIGLDGALNMIDVILFRAGGADRGQADLTGGHVKIDDEGQRAVANVLELPSFHFAGSHR